MKTIVLIKQVPNVAEIQFDRETRTLRREGVHLEVSSFDVRALLRAIELRAELGGEVVAVTMGPPQARDALVHCLALGADRGIHLVDPAFAGADTLATARALALALRREAVDLVLCGKASVDAETGQVGPEVAELLDLPQVTAARTLEIDPASRVLRAERELDDGFETVECPLPALVTAAEDLAPERFPKRAEKEAARSKPIAEVRASDLTDDPKLFGFAGSPTRVEAIETREEKREGRVLEGAAEAAATELVRLLAERRVFSREAVETPAARRTSPRKSGLRIWVLAEASGGEVRRVTLELLGKAVELAGASGGEVVALLAGAGVRRHGDLLGRHGAGRVLVADDPRLGEYSTEVFAAVLARAIERGKPTSVLAPSTSFGRDVAPRVAARLGLGLTGDCLDLSLDAEGRLVQWKPAFGGNIVAPIVSSTRPEMATVRTGMLRPIAPADGARASIEEISLGGLPASRTRVIGRRTAPGVERAKALDDAAVAVGVGKGIGGPEALPRIESFARVLGGAAIAASRDLTDAGWLPRQCQVGLTGRAIAPKLYFAIGIRGAFEHMVGVGRAGTIVAINSNPKAPVFRHADLGVVGDWKLVLPALEAAIDEAGLVRPAMPRG